MTGPSAPPAHVRTYLEEVRRHLGDLPGDDRAELTAPVEQRLVELFARGADPVDVERQFGSPAQLAADLRSSAGYPPPAAPSGGSWFGSRLQRTSANPWVAAVIGYLFSLRPAWWAARGYLVLGGVLAVLGPDKYGLHTIGYYDQLFVAATPSHGNVLWVAIPLLAIGASIALGVSTPRLPPTTRWIVAALDLAAVVVLLAFPTWWMPPAGAYFAGLAG
jgi:hypothetical protein